MEIGDLVHLDPWKFLLYSLRSLMLGVKINLKSVLNNMDYRSR